MSREMGENHLSSHHYHSPQQDLSGLLGSLFFSISLWMKLKRSGEEECCVILLGLKLTVGERERVFSLSSTRIFVGIKCVWRSKWTGVKGAVSQQKKLHAFPGSLTSLLCGGEHAMLGRAARRTER